MYLDIVLVNTTGADPGFSFGGGGGGGRKRLHYKRKIRSPFRQGSSRGF